MANIDRIVNVQISLNTTGITQLGFSTVLVVGAHAHSLSRVTSYTDVDEMLDDGFDVSEPLYKAVSACFSQTPRPTAVKVGRIACNTVNVNVTNVLASGTYTLIIKTKDTDGNVTKKTYEYKNNGGEASVIAAGLEALITADKDAVVTAATSGNALVLTKKSADFAVETPANLTATAGTTNESVAASMAAILAEDNDFYGIILADRSNVDTVMDMAAWTETHMNLFLVSTAEEGAADASVTTDLLSKLSDKNYYRTSGWYHALADEYPEAAVMARCFAIEPGGETWANKKLAGVTADHLTETQYNAITKKNGNTFEKFRNVSITQNGKVAAGEWIDVIRFRDWLQEEIRTNEFYLLINTDKVPYTDAGIAAVESVLRKALEDGQARGGIAPTEYDADGNKNLGFTIDVPLASSITANQKASRVLKDLKFTARLAGAIHAIKITGSFTYDNLIETSA